MLVLAVATEFEILATIDQRWPPTAVGRAAKNCSAPVGPAHKGAGWTKVGAEGRAGLGCLEQAPQQDLDEVGVAAAGWLGLAIADSVDGEGEAAGVQVLENGSW